MQPSTHYDYPQEFEYTRENEYPKKAIARVFGSPDLLSYRLPNNTINNNNHNNTHYPSTTTTSSSSSTSSINAYQASSVPSPNEYDYPTTAQYPKKAMGRDPRVWSPNLLSHRLPNNNHEGMRFSNGSSNVQPIPNEYLVHYEYPQGSEYPKKDMGRDPRVWSPNLLSHRLPNNQHHTQPQQTHQSQQSQISLPPNNYYESFEYTGELYPKKNMGRDPRVWSPNLLSHRLPNNTINDSNAHPLSHTETFIQNQNYPSQLAEYEYTSQGADYPKKDIGRDPRVWSPNLLSHRLPNVSDNTVKQATETTTTTTTTPTTPTTTLTYTPNEFEYSCESEYPEKDMGRDPRVWSPNLLSHRIPSENSSKKSGEVVFPVRRYSRAKL